MITLYNQNIWNKIPAGYRNTLVRKLVAEVDADVCTFQECGPISCRVGNPPIAGLMSDVYEEAMPQIAATNYTPVYYKRDKFTLIEDGYLLYDGMNDCNSKGLTWAVLEEKENGRRWAFVSTHFWWMYRGQEDSDQRVENAKQLKAVCDSIVEKYHIPVIIGGDFNNGKNSAQGDAPYHAMCGWGFRDIRYLAEMSTDQEYTCRDAYPTVREDETFEKCPKPPHMCIDYIFQYGDPQVPVRRFHIETNDMALTASDHCPLIGWFDTSF